LRHILLQLLSLVFALGIWGQEIQTTQIGEDLFKWGEYDSLVRLLEPATKSESLSQLKTGADSAIRAKSFLFLGVAFYATGKKEQANDAFNRACDLDPLVKLDRFYVTEEIANHFQAIAMDGIRRQRTNEAIKMVSVSLENPETASKQKAIGHNPNYQERTTKHWLWWGLGVTAMAAAGTGVLYFSSQKTPPDKITMIDAK
jgi:tetratricopeptide (TPR) repeat protein